MIELDLGRDDDLAAIKDLLVATNLTVEGLMAVPTTLVVARDQRRVVGAAYDRRSGSRRVRGIGASQDRAGLGQRIGKSPEQPGREPRTGAAIQRRPGGPTGLFPDRRQGLAVCAEGAGADRGRDAAGYPARGTRVFHQSQPHGGDAYQVSKDKVMSNE